MGSCCRCEKNLIRMLIWIPWKYIYTYNAMLDMYSDSTMLQVRMEIHIEVLEISDLNQCVEETTQEEIKGKLEEILDFFRIGGNDASDPMVGRPSEEFEWSARVAVALERPVKEYNLDALTCYYHGAPGGSYEKLQNGFIVGHFLLTAAGSSVTGKEI